MVFTNSPRTVMVWTRASYLSCAGACMHACAQLSFMPLSRVPRRRCTPRTPRTQAERGGRYHRERRRVARLGPRTPALRTGVNYASREMSNCSPYRKIYNSSRCGKHYVPSPTPDTHSARSFPPCLADSTPPRTPLSHPYSRSRDDPPFVGRALRLPEGVLKLSFSLFFRSIPNYFRGGEAKSSAFRSLFKSCFCFRPFLFYSWVVDIKAYTEGLVVERGLKFRSKECREILGQRVYTRTQTRTYTCTQAERNNRGCGSGTRSDLAIFPPRPVSNRQSGSALVH